jgi:hypothetical protein
MCVYAIQMTSRTARSLRHATFEVVRFYKMHHLGDPDPLRDGRVLLGGRECKSKLRAGIRQPDLDRRDNLVIAIGGSTAKDDLADRLSWGGIPVQKRPNGTVEFEDAFYLAQRSPHDWRERFPLAAKYVDTVGRGHRVHNIPAAVRDEFIEMFEWGREVEASIGRTPSPSTPDGRGPCPEPSCPRRRSGRC